MNEFKAKEGRICALLAEHGLDALLLRRASSFAWATCGASAVVNVASSWGEAALLFTPSGNYLLTNNIEAVRLEQEGRLQEQGWAFEVTPWPEPSSTVERLCRGLALGADGPYPGALDLSGALARLRSQLTTEEGERFWALGRHCAAAMMAAVQRVQPGQSEFEIAAALAYEAESRGVQAVVDLVATDERALLFRHPLPTEKKLDRYAMLVLCGRRWGLVCSLTRCLHFGPVPAELRRKAIAAAQVDAAMIAATRPGETLGRVLDRAMQAYARAGFPGEWQFHHQGGAAGYEPREYLAVPGSEEVVSLGQVYAWNPSVAGTKSEDTILVGPEENQVLTAMAGWPLLPPTAEGASLPRPAILELA